MTTRAHTIDRIIGHKDLIATVDAQPCALGVVDHVVDHTDGIGFVVQPGRLHVFKACALPGGESACAAVVDLVAFHGEIGRAALDIGAPIAAIVDAIPAQMAVLDGDKIHNVILGAVNIAALNIDVLRLVDLDGLPGGAAAAVHVYIANEQIGAALTVEDVATVLDGKVEQIKVVYIKDVKRDIQPRRAKAIGRVQEDGELCRAVAIFPIMGDAFRRIVACHQLHAIACASERRAGGDALPRRARWCAAPPRVINHRCCRCR